MDAEQDIYEVYRIVDKRNNDGMVIKIRFFGNSFLLSFQIIRFLI